MVFHFLKQSSANEENCPFVFPSSFWKIVKEKPLELSAGCKETGDWGSGQIKEVDSRQLRILRRVHGSFDPVCNGCKTSGLYQDQSGV